MRTRTLTAACLALVAAVGVAGCGSDDTTGAGAGAGGGADLEGTLTVLAAASLTEAFGELAEDFESEHDGVKVRLAFDSSATLAEQVSQGAPADVLATADERTMQMVVDAGANADAPEVFATNQLEVVVPHRNPAGLKRFDDIDDPEVDYVVCVRSAPCGDLAAKVLDENGITAEPASEEVDVKAVLSKVQLDEADAGIVYATDAVAAGDQVEGIDIPTSEDSLNTYPITTVKGAEEPDLAEAWLDLVTSDKGQQVLQDAGFGRP